MPDYRIDIKPRAMRSLSRLDPTVRKAVEQDIDSLKAEPRPSTATRLVAYRAYLRIRSGDYRIIYAINYQAKIVTIVAIKHRCEGYRKLGR